MLRCAILLRQFHSIINTIFLHYTFHLFSTFFSFLSCNQHIWYLFICFLKYLHESIICCIHYFIFKNMDSAWLILGKLMDHLFWFNRFEKPALSYIVNYIFLGLLGCLIRIFTRRESAILLNRPDEIAFANFIDEPFCLKVIDWKDI